MGSQIFQRSIETMQQYIRYW